MNRYSSYIFIVISVFAAAVSLFGWRNRTQTSVAAAVEEIQPQPRRAKLLFVGDVMCHLPQVYAAARNGEYDFTQSFRHVAPIIGSADIAIANFETVVSPNDRYAGYPTFASPSALPAALRLAGFDILLTANNHCCDRLGRGIIRTADCIDSLGMARTGAFRDTTDYMSRHPLRFEHDSIRFALLNYTYGTNGIDIPAGCIVNLIDTVTMARDLSLSRDADCRIVCIHWGEEYFRHPTRTQRRLSEFLHRHGADLVIGSHPHVIEPFEIDSCGRITLYSLGNFVSNQRKRYCDGGLIAEIEIVKEPDGTMRYELELQPVWVKVPDYAVLPRAVADTLRMRSDERAAYELFISDTEALLSESVRLE